MSIPQEINYRLEAIKCAEGYGVKKASVKYHTSPASIYRWTKKLKENNNDPKSLTDKSRCPHSHPNNHTEEEITPIKNIRRRRSPNLGLQDLWLRLKERGYARTQLALLKNQCAITYFTAESDLNHL